MCQVPRYFERGEEGSVAQGGGECCMPRRRCWDAPAGVDEHRAPRLRTLS